MSARKIRRAAEHKARKLARIAEKERLKNSADQKPNSPAPSPEPQDAPEPAEALESHQPAALAEESEEATKPTTSQAQIDANRANAQLSTGTYQRKR